jgi:four helix bundle protein
MRNFRDIKVWEKSHALTLSIYRESRALPKEEVYALTSQMRRAAASIATNLAESSGRGSHADFARFTQMAIGSASELEYLLLLARDLRYFDLATHRKLEEQTIEVRRMLISFQQSFSPTAPSRTKVHFTALCSLLIAHLTPSSARAGGTGRR